jgi:hypothetical protein
MRDRRRPRRSQPERAEAGDATKDVFEASIAVAYLKVDDKAGLETR